MKKILLYAGIILGFLVLSYAFVPEVLSGKIVNQSDISGFQGMARESALWNSQHPDDHTAWTGSMFSGMPNTSIIAHSEGDFTLTLYNLLQLGKRPASYIFISLLGAFLMLLAFGIHPLVAAGGAIAVAFCSYNMQIVQVGHNSKMLALAFLPWVLAALVYTYRSAQKEGKPALARTFLGAALFGIAVSFQVKANHQQISYYLAMLIAVYVVAHFIHLLRTHGSVRRFFLSSALLLVLGVTGVVTNSNKLLPLFEYTPYTMRGGSTDGERKGLDLEYATAWSYGWEELPNLAIPDYNGGSSAGGINPAKSETCKLLRKAGKDTREISRNLPLYWGPQPFTAGPMYMGAVTVFLFILGLMFYKGWNKWWILAITVLAVLLSLGNHFLWFTRLFYDYVPMYNKFRTVSMSLVLLQFTLPILACLMLNDIVRRKVEPADMSKGVLYAGGGTALFYVLLSLLMTVCGTFTGAGDAGQPDVLTQALAADRLSLLWKDTWRSVILVLLAGAALYAGCRKNVKWCLLVGVLVLVDMFSVDKRYLGADDFVSARKFKSQFELRPADESILEDKDPSYRVLDLTTNVFNDSHPSYWHKNIGGYSPAKLQIYQEYIDSHLSGEIRTLYKALSSARTVGEAEAALPKLEGLSALNCRYIIIDGECSPLRYPYAMGNAWFPSGAGEIELVKYESARLHYRYSADSTAVAVFSEVHYPVGWKATLEDGSAVELGKASDLAAGTPGSEVLRAAVLPAGEHGLTMEFAPDSYSRGEVISRVSSIALILIALLALAAQAYLVRKDGSKS